MKTSELTGAALDWAVEWAETGVCPDPDDFVMRTADESPSTNWAQGGPIIERICITVAPFYERWVAAPSVGEFIRDSDGDCMTIAMWDSEPHFYGPTPLIAAMRCRVASKLGDEVDVPKELTC